MAPPFLRRIREESWEAGHQKGLDEGLKAVETRYQADLQEAQLMTRREDVLNALVLRFDPPTSISRLIDKKLQQVAEREELEDFFSLAIQCDTIDAFQTALDDLTTA